MRHTLKVWALRLTAVSIVTLRAADNTRATAAQINGTWATPAGEFKIWALDHRRLRVEFSVAAEHKREIGTMVTASRRSRVTPLSSDPTVLTPIVELP
jgi:hypothetical protein